MTCNKMKKLRREWHTNQEARAHETLAMQASQWKIHCEELTQQCDAETARYAERISEMERDLEDVSSRYIEASEKLEMHKRLNQLTGKSQLIGSMKF